MLLAWLVAFLTGVQAWAAPEAVAQRAIEAQAWPPGTEVAVAGASSDGDLLGWTGPDGSVTIYIEEHVLLAGGSYTALVREIQRTVEHEADHAWCLDQGGRIGHEGPEPSCS